MENRMEKNKKETLEGKLKKRLGGKEEAKKEEWTREKKQGFDKDRKGQKEES